MLVMKRKVLETIKGWLDKSRLVEIQPGEIVVVESTSPMVGNQIRVQLITFHTEGFEYVMVDQDELESCSVLI
jgi:TusA-related sulfurtransferase